MPPYTKQVWADNDPTKPLSAARMNVLEEGVETAQATADEALPAASATLNSLTDVAITNPSEGQVLKRVGSQWVNAADATGGGGGTATDTRLRENIFDLRDYGGVPNDPAQEVGPAWDAAMAALVTAGGGILDLGGDTYYTARAPITTSARNAQLPLPNIDAATSPKVSITIRGGGFPGSYRGSNQAVAQKTANGGRIISTRTGATYDSTNGIPSVIGCKENWARNIHDTFAYSNIHVRIENLSVICPNDPSLTAVDLSGCAEAEGDGLVVDCDVSGAAFGGYTLPTKPWAHGVRFPGLNANATHRWGTVTVFGFYAGVIATEHTNIDHCIVVCNRIGWGIDRGFGHMIRFGVLLTENNRYHIAGVNPAAAAGGDTGVVDVPNDTHFTIDQLDIEDASGAFASGAFGTVSHIKDAGNKLMGYADYYRTISGVGPQSSLIQTGGGSAQFRNVRSVAAATVPGQVGTVTATPGNGQVALTWSAPSNGGSSITDYEVFFRTGAAAFAKFTDAVTAVPGATVTGLTNGTAYDFQVRAVNAVGSGAFSATASATPTAAPTAPGQVTGLTGSPGNQQVVLSWSAPSNGGSAITDYLVEFRTGSNAFATFADVVSAATTATVTGLTNGTLYDFRVSAINAVGTGTASATYSATPTAVTNISDDFNRADSATTMGSTSVGNVAWDPMGTGIYGISSNRAYYVSGNNVTFSGTILETGAANGTLSLTYPNAGIDSQFTGAVIRYVDDNNYLIFHNGTAFEKVAGADPVSLGSYSTGFNAQSGAAEVMTIELNGSSIVVKRDGATVLNLTTTRFQTATKHGLYFNAKTTARFDNFSFTPA